MPVRDPGGVHPLSDSPPLVPVERWARVGDFLPTSPQQVKSYLKHKGYKIPKHRKTKLETADKEALEAIARKHPEEKVVPLILHGRHISKASGYLSDNMVGSDGRIHPLYTFLPKTGRLSSKRPNLMNLPTGRGAGIMEKAAEAVRGTLIPSDGYIFGEFDWKAIEALLVGYFAQDPDYMRVAKLGVHAYVASHGIGKPADLTKSDAEILEYFAWIKKHEPDAYAKFKKANHSNNYGQGILNMSKDLGLSVAETKKIVAIIDAASPKVTAWKKETRLRAHAEGALTNPFGYLLHFFEVFRRGYNGQWELGREASEALAFLPQSTGAGMLRETLLLLAAHPRHGVDFQLLIPTHDSVTFEMKRACANEIMLLVQSIMERKWPELGGLSVEAEGSWGYTLEKKRLALWSNGAALPS